MKRMIAALALLCLVQSVPIAMAAQRGTAEYEKLKEYKKAQREKNPSAPAEKGFWQKEAERSGFAGTAAAFVHAIPGNNQNSNQ